MNEAEDFAWRVHEAQEAWTAKVDVKASILLALNGALIAVVLTGHAKGGVLEGVSGWRMWAITTGTCLLLVSALLSALAVLSKLGRTKDHLRDYEKNLIYFGHLRHWGTDTTGLAEALQSRVPANGDEILAKQLITMSKLNWVKHRRLQFAVLTLIGGAGLVSLAVLWVR